MRAMVTTERVETVLQEAEKPLATNQVADKLGVSWHTARDRLLKLHEKNRIHRSQVSKRLILWWDREIPF